MKRLVLFIGDKQCLAVKWTRGMGEGRKIFPNSEEGRREFESYLGGMKKFTASVLADLVEEDYRHESLPHLNWRDRKHFLARKLEQYYRYTPLRNALFQGREGKTDKVLFSALTNQNLVLPWMALLAKMKVPLTGVCSVAMLSDRLVRKIPASHLMLLSVQEGTGLRQSFFLKGRLNFSRLTPIHPGDDPLAVVRVESERAYSYLHALNLLPEQGALMVCILCSPEDSEKLAEMLEDTPAIQRVFVDPLQAARRAGYTGKIDGSDALPIFMHLLGPGINQYGSGEHTHLNDLRQWRLASNALSASFAAAGLIFAGIDAPRAISLHARVGVLAAQRDAVMSRYRKLVPPDSGPNSPQKMKAAVMLSESISAAFPKPEKLLSMVSRALDSFPGIRMNRISWRVSNKPESSKDKTDAAPEQDLVMFGPHYVVISIDGEIVPFDGNFRIANETVDGFCNELGKSGMSVTKIKLPLNLSPDISLVGKPGQPGAKADFSIKAIWKRAS